MKKTLTLTLLFIAAIAKAQVGMISLKEYADLKKRTLIVVVEEPLPDLEAKLDATQVQVYRKEIEDYNTLVKSAMDTYYKVGNPVEYKSVGESLDIINKKDKAYAYLSFTKFRTNYHTKTSFEMTQKNRVAKEQTRLSGALSIDFIVSLIEIRFTDQSKDGLPVYGQYLPTPFPGKADMTFAFRQMASVLSEREQGMSFNDAKKQLKKAQSQTLLVAENDIDPSGDKTKFISWYKFPLEIAPDDKISDAIINGNPQYTCIITVPTFNREAKKVEFNFFMFDCGNGKVIATSAVQDQAGVSFGGMSALKSLKRAVTETKTPPIKKENMADFNNAVK